MAISTTMRAATALLGVFVVAVVLALVVTVAETATEVRLLAVALVSPIIVLSLVFIRYSRLGRVWAYVGASVLGALGVVLRLVVSTRPSLEVGGGLPVWVTVLYIVLGALVSVLNLESALELRGSHAAQP